jgi:prepilin-type processing-associated H-X9-DG protein
MNTDFGGGEVWNPGNARFRHNGLGCDVCFADGSVKTLFPQRPQVGCRLGREHLPRQRLQALHADDQVASKVESKIPETYN